jgi:predicted MPP superfamily phosphohydrolase
MSAPYLVTKELSWIVTAVLAAAWLAWPVMLWSGWRALRPAAPLSKRLTPLAWFVASALFAYAHFIEPRWITQRHTHLTLGFPARIAVVSDYHLGMFKGPDFLDRVVDRLNELEVDAVLIAGDHLCLPQRPLVELLAPLKRIRHPVFSVPGNHDDAPGPVEARQALDLRQALQSLGVKTVEYTHAEMPRFTIVGLGDHYAGRDGREALVSAPRHKPVIALFHNPDTAMSLQPGDAVLAVAGHTHGGQLRIPGLFRNMIPTQHAFDRGLHTFPPVPTFVSSGLGESGVPLRLFNPPVIDVLEID